MSPDPVVPPLRIALKAVFYEAYHRAGIAQRRLARYLAVAESEVRSLLNPDHATKAETIDAAPRQVCLLNVGKPAEARPKKQA